jgi:hypothetical protein
MHQNCTYRCFNHTLKRLIIPRTRHKNTKNGKIGDQQLPSRSLAKSCSNWRGLAMHADAS